MRDRALARLQGRRRDSAQVALASRLASCSFQRAGANLSACSAGKLQLGNCYRTVVRGCIVDRRVAYERSSLEMSTWLTRRSAGIQCQLLARGSWCWWRSLCRFVSALVSQGLCFVVQTRCHLVCHVACVCVCVCFTLQLLFCSVGQVGVSTRCQVIQGVLCLRSANTCAMCRLHHTRMFAPGQVPTPLWRGLASTGRQACAFCRIPARRSDTGLGALRIWELPHIGTSPSEPPTRPGVRHASACTPGPGESKEKED